MTPPSKLMPMFTAEDIHRCEMFTGLPAGACSALAERARPVEFGRGQPIATAIAPVKRLVFVQDGLAKLVGRSADGEARVLHLYRVDDAIGLHSVFDAAGPTCDVVTVHPVRGAALAGRDLFSLMGRHPEIILAMAREYGRLLANINERLMAVMSQDVTVRLSQVLLQYADKDAVPEDEYVPLAGTMTHSLLAQLVGASRPYTSVIVSRLEEEGALRKVGRYSIRVHPSRLQAIIAAERAA